MSARELRSYDRSGLARSLPAWLSSWLACAAVAMLAATVQAHSRSHNVKDFGATGDGVAVETAVLQGAIDACAVEGGCVLTFPAGRYLTGTLYFRDNITLHLAPGAVLATSGRAEDFTAPALLYGKGVNAVTLTGGGEIQAGPVPAPDETTVRNPGSRIVSLMLVENSTNVRVSGVRFLRSPAGTLTFRVVDGLWVEDVLIDNAMMAAGTSGVVLDSSTRATLRGLHFRGGGDGITLQTSLVDGIAPPTSEVTVSDCTLRSGSTAFKIGTATYGDIRNVVFANSVIESSQGGIGVFVRDGATVESLQFANLVIHTSSLRKGRTEWPILLDVKRREQESRAGSLQDVRFANLQVRTAGKIVLSGMAGKPIRDLHVDGMLLRHHGSGDLPLRAERPWKAELDSVAGEDETNSAILGGYLANATLAGVELVWEAQDLSTESHALFVHSSDGIRLDRVSLRQRKVGGTVASIQFVSSRRIEIRNSTAPPQTGVWVLGQGVPRQEFFLSGNYTAAAYRDIVYLK